MPLACMCRDKIDYILTQLTNQASPASGGPVQVPCSIPISIFRSRSGPIPKKKKKPDVFSNNAIFHVPYTVNDRENKMTNFVPDILLIFRDNSALNSVFICTTSVFLNK